ncbi:hypothetical protein GCM10009535_00260 [Streptomyces thermocarboxydovorans]|uniref:Uncharacterized protein n=1 Tax=Streptomyces thermocarboxydovorans TaxID=59298 RepID=A0ABN1H4M1_9ACTN
MQNLTVSALLAKLMRAQGGEAGAPGGELLDTAGAPREDHSALGSLNGSATV